jgi:acetyl-CoA acetyltransferase
MKPVMNSSHSVYALGVGTTRFKRWPKRDHIDLAREALHEALTDAGLSDGQRLSRVWFGNCGMHYWGQSNIRGQAVCAPLAAEGLLAQAPAVVNVEGGCATGSLAAYGALGDLLSGRADFAVALGVEKTLIAHNPAKILELFASGMNQWTQHEDREFYRQEAERVGAEFNPAPDRIILLDISALHAQAHMRRYNVTPEQIAWVASKSHKHGALNPKAQYQAEMSVDEILKDHAILSPLTRSMCAPISDGAAAVIFVSARGLSELSPTQRARAVPILACEMSGGQVASWDAEGPTARAAQRAYQMAHCGPKDVHIVELHDSTAYSEILHLEELGLCPVGQAAQQSLAGYTQLDGPLPVNMSGGLISKGHPLGASGLAMIGEVATQLRREGGQRQCQPQGGELTLGLAQNGGGLLGFQEASSVVTLLGAPQL